MNHFEPSKSSPEILAPVANFDMCAAAVHNGANAVYVGIPGFNARGRTADLSFQELQKIIEYCHLYGLKVYGALNILIFEEELRDILSIVYQVAGFGLDAFIVQDIGVASLLKEIAVEIPLHASTQMTVGSSEAIAFYNDLGFKRYVLARELSLEEIAGLRKNTSNELEVFVHGALCISYSGQCLASELMFNRSANRGQCAQNCRLDYLVEVDGKIKSQIKQNIFSPKDLEAFSALPELESMNVDSFKIEGRLKSPEYVAAVCRAYSHKKLPSEMDVLFSRGKSVGWLKGQQHQELMNLHYSHHRGKRIGEVKSLIKKEKFPTLLLRSSVQLQAGDSLLFVEDNNDVSGGKIYQIQDDSGGFFKVSFAKEVSFKQVKAGTEVYWNSSSSLDKQFQQSWKNRDLLKKVPLRLEVKGKAGSRLHLSVQDDAGRVLNLTSESNLEKAERSPLDYDTLKKTMGALAGTAFQLGSLSVELEGKLFLHNKEIKQLKKTFAEALTRQRTEVKTYTFAPQQKMLEKLTSIASVNHEPATPSLHLLVKSIPDFTKLQDLGIGTVYLDFPGVGQIRAAGRALRQTSLKLGLTTPRVFKGNEVNYLKNILKFKPDVILVRSPGAWEWIKQSELYRKEIELVADFSFNVTNHLSMDWLIKKGLDRVTPSYDLNAKQFLDLSKAGSADKVECIIHSRVPVFHMEYCVYANQLGTGENINTCGMPCKDHEIRIHGDNERPLRMEVDSFCRNTAYLDENLSYSEMIEDMRSVGINHFRLEWQGKNTEELRHLLEYYQARLKGELEDKKLSGLKSLCSEKVINGMLFKQDNYQDRKKINGF